MSELNPADVTHLRVHSYYSLLEGTASVHDLAARAASDGMSALALTDSNGLYGTVAFTRACHAVGIRPITGMTVNVAPPPQEMPDDLPHPGRLVLLAMGLEGYQSLCRLSACLQAYPDREMRVQQGLSWDNLKTHNHDLICIEAGQAGWLARFLWAGQHQAASRYAGRLGAIFPDRCYVGLEIYQPQDVALAHEMIQIGARFGMEPVAAQPVYALEREALELRPLLMAIDHNCHIDAATDLLPGSHWLAPSDMAACFADFPEATANISHIMQRCRPALPDGRPIWPVLDLPAEKTVEDVLVETAETGLAERVSYAAVDYGLRLQRELEAINHHGFAPLFLLVADLVRFARTHGVPVSTRGSVANSLVAYALGITTVDPIAHGLLFERFLNPARANLPDIDLDFCSRRRDEVLAYVQEKYGAERVALVGTMSTLQPKSAVREVAKAYGIPEGRIKKLSALLPHHWHPDPRRRESLDVTTILADVADETEQLAVQQAFRLIGQPHHLSLHPGGIVITPGNLTDVVPVQWATKGYLATQVDFRDVEVLGLQKIDLLGIRALTVLADTAVAVRAAHDPAFQLVDIPLDDVQTANLLQQGDTIGVFQCESSGAQRTLRQLQVRTIHDLAIANAFFKPGPATGGMAKSFIRRYRGQEPVSYLHPALQPILGATQGVLLFQEQILRLAVEIAGLSWEQADYLRRGMSKFQAREMAAMRLTFILGCQRPSPVGPAFSQQQAETLWEQVMAFAGYGFNQGHATAYADVSYRSAYLKAHYPAEFLCARLMDHGGFHHPAVYIAEARRLGIPVLPPHVNVSGRKVTLQRTAGKGGGKAGKKPREPLHTQHAAALWLGLGQVRDLRRESVRGIVTAREARSFTSLRDLLDRVPLQTKEAQHLIQCGALDGLGESRAAMLAEAAQVARAGNVRQMTFDFVQETAVPYETMTQRLQWEMHVLGLPVSVNPLHLVDLSPMTPLRELQQYHNQLVTVAGFRLPGWTGGKGWFLSDGDSFVIVQGGERPSNWEVVVIDGRYRLDEWGGGRFQSESISEKRSLNGSGSVPR